MKKKTAIWVVLSVLLCAALMSFVDGVVRPHYAVKSAVKVVVFLLIPLVYVLFDRAQMPRVKALFVPKRKEFVGALALGGAVYAVILGGYFLLRGVIDFSGIAGQLTQSAGVSAENFVFVALYISFANSLLEEFFFRGYAFLTLKHLTSRPFAYCFSSALFALYHMGMTAGWFSPLVWLIAMVGLFVGGCIFNLLNEKSGTIYPSWLVHMCANFAINTVGFILFGIIAV